MRLKFKIYLKSILIRHLYMKNKNCPNCNKNMIHFERYPKMICHECVELATTENGENIKFYNIDHTGGFISIVNNIQGEIHD